MKPCLFNFAAMLTLASCGGGGGSDSRPRPNTGDAQAIPQISINDEFEVEGNLKGTVGGPEGYGQKLTKTYQLQVEHKTALSVTEVSTVAFCPEGAQVVGPFFALSSDEETSVSTDLYQDELAIEEKAFPGKVEAGTYTLTVTIYGRGDCQFQYTGKFNPRSDMAVLEAGEWDPTLTGTWHFNDWEKHQRTWTFAPKLVTQQLKNKQDKVLADVDYVPKIDGSVIPGKLALTVKAVRRLAGGEVKIQKGDRLLCIYRSFAGYHSDPALWITCNGPRDKSYPEDFDYPLHEYQR